MTNPRTENDFGTSLTILRMCLGMNQVQFADRAGITHSSLSDYEQGKVKPRPRSLQKIAGGFGLTVPELRVFLDQPLLLRSLLLARTAPATGSPAADGGATAATAGQLVERFLAFTLPLLRTDLLVRARECATVPEATGATPAQLLTLLERYSYEQQQALVEEMEECWNWSFGDFLCTTSAATARDSAARALELADLACRVADRVSENERPRARLVATAYLANALRVRGDLPAAGKAFATAEKLRRARGVAGMLLVADRVRLLDLEASLRRDQRRLTVSLSLLEQALALDETCGGERAARLLVKKGKTLEEKNDFAAAVETLERATPLVDAANDPRLLFAHRFNLAENLVHVGRHAEVEGRLPEVRELTARLGNDLDALRLTWLEGRLAVGGGRIDEGIRLFSRVRDRFAALGIAYDTALVTLELAVVLAEEGRTAEVKTLAAETAKIFKAQQVERERLGAVRLFCQAVAREQLSAALARDLLGKLRQGA